MKKDYVFLFLALLISVCFSSELRIYTEISGQVQYLDNNNILTGSSVEMVREIQKRIGNDSQIQVVPWSRGYKELNSGPCVLLFSTTLTEERAPLFKWVGPVYNLDWAFYVRKGSNIKINSLDDAKTLFKIGTIRDDAREEFLKSNGFTNLDSATTGMLNIKKLVAGRVEAIIGSDSGVIANLKEAGFSQEEVEKAFTFRTFELYLSFSKDTPNAIVEKWDAAMKELYEDGTFKEIYTKYYPVESIPEYKVLEDRSGSK